MTKVLYVNHGLGAHCGVYDFGKRQFNHLAKSSLLDAVYAECNSADEYASIYAIHQPSIVFFNYMPIVMPWLSRESISIFPAKRVVVQHLFDPSSITAIMNSYSGLFDYMICNDPTLKITDNRIFSVNRTIHASPNTQNGLSGGEIRIGSFGFGLPHKNFHIIMREINKHFDNAVLNLHMTVGTFTGDYTDGIIQSILKEMTKPNIRLNHTNDYLSEEEIIESLASNDINALFYELPPSNAGISSSADYLIASGKPMLLSDCALFRHIDESVPRYPNVNFADIVNSYDTFSNNAIDLKNKYANLFIDDIEKIIKEIL
jgi:hypothetical protein